MKQLPIAFFSLPINSHKEVDVLISIKREIVLEEESARYGQ